MLAADDGKAAAELLPGLADGSLRGAVSLDGPVSGSRDASGAVTITGTVAALGAANAEIVLLPVELDDVSLWIALDTSALTVRTASGIDVTRSTALVTAEQLRVPATRRDIGVTDRDLLDLSHDVLAVSDSAIVALARGHHDAEHEIAGYEQDRVTDLVRGILLGTLSRAEIRVRIDSYGLDPDGDYYAIRTRKSPNPQSGEHTRPLVVSLVSSSGVRFRRSGRRGRGRRLCRVRLRERRR